MAASEEKDKGGFTVTDRRAFTPEGQPRAGSESAPAPETPRPPGPETPGAPGPTRSAATVGSPAASGGPTAATGGGRPAATRPAPQLPPVDFPTFALSLASSVLYHLGEGETSGQTADTNLPMAKHTIDILSMLQEKTKGNLNAPEAELLENLLCDLRLRYVAAAKS